MCRTSDFETIILTKKENKTLKLLAKKKIAIILNPDIANALDNYSLLAQTIKGSDDYGDPITDGSYSINDRGSRYLIYL